MTNSKTDSTHDCCALPGADPAPTIQRTSAGDALQAAPPDPSPPARSPRDKSRRWSVAAITGAVLSAVVASLCCVGPLVFALLGLGGGALLVKFEPYRPYFMALTFVLLGAGFYFTYCKPKAAAKTAEGDACGCPAPRTNRVGRIMLWVATGLVVAALAFPYIVPLIWG